MARTGSIIFVIVYNTPNKSRMIRRRSEKKQMGQNPEQLRQETLRLMQQEEQNVAEIMILLRNLLEKSSRKPFFFSLHFTRFR
jgi:hypothetical protein